MILIPRCRFSEFEYMGSMEPLVSEYPELESYKPMKERNTSTYETNMDFIFQILEDN